MKTILMLGGLLFSFPLMAAVDFSPTAASVVIEKGPNHRLWETPRSFTNDLGEEISITNQFRELATGMHYWDGTNWIESQEQIEVFPGGAAALKGQHKVIFSPNCNSTGAIDLLTSDGSRLQSHVLGISYFDPGTGNSALIADLQDSTGQLVSQNQVVWSNAFNGLNADIRASWMRSGFEQDIILHESPYPPSSYGLNDSVSYLQILTEFDEAPVPANTVETSGYSIDEPLGFGNMQMVRGKAFLQSNTGQSFDFKKRWQIIQGRKFLIESVPYQAIVATLDTLPRMAATTPQQLLAKRSSNRVLPLAKIK